MEVLKGKRSYAITRCELNALVSSHDGVTLDIGTGDGRAVLHEARASPSRLVIGLDACRENLHAGSRVAPSNALFVIANALSLPDALDNLAQHITITFPWGSLLQGLLDGTDCLGAGLRRVALPGARFEIRLNGGALDAAGWPLEEGGERVRLALRQWGFEVGRPSPLLPENLRDYPSTWAKRLAFGRDPRGVSLVAFLVPSQYRESTDTATKGADDARHDDGLPADSTALSGSEPAALRA